VLALVGVELPAEFRAAVSEVAWRFTILGTLAGLTVLLAAVFLVRQRVHVPIYRLVRSMRGADDDAPRRARVRWNDEIGVLTEHYNDMVDRLVAKDRELRQLYDTAREQADYLQGYSNYLVAGVPHGVVAVDDKGVLTVWNPGAARILRRQGELGQPLESQLDDDHPLCRALCGALRDGSVTSQAMIVLEGEEEDAQRLLELSCAPFRGDQGELLGAAALVDDRTELEQLRRAASRNERLAAIGNLGAGLAHEIKNPLGAISGFAELIQRKEGADAARLAGRLRDEVLELDRFLKEFLAFAREDKIRREPCDLNEVVVRGAELGLTGMGLGPAEVQALLEGEVVEIASHECRLELELADDLPPLALDAGLVRSACANLTANAFQAMKGGGNLHVRTYRAGKQVQLKFRDNGPGVPLQDRERIFDPLFTTRAEGTGLGLAITHKAVIAQGGEIAIRDAPGGGAEFVVRLPIVEAEVGQQAPGADALAPGS
jgi:two-component system sensor histidine kinase AtoS